MKVKVLIITEVLGGGVRKHILDLLNHINLNHFELFLVYSGKRTDDVFMSEIECLKSKGIKLLEISMSERVGIDDLKSVMKLAKIIETVKPHVIHCHSSKAGGIGRIAARIKNVRNVYYTPHAYYAQSDMNTLKKYAYMFVERALSTITKKTINVSEGEHEFAVKNKIVSKEFATIIYNGIAEPAIPHHLPGSHPNKLVIGTAARMNSQKDPWTFYNIAKKIIDHHPSVEFQYVGDGPYFKELKEMIMKEKYDKKIKLFGFVNNPSHIVNQFDVFLTTSLYEGLPYALIEAMSLGKPVVATDVTGNNEIVKHGVNGYLFEKQNVDDGVKKLNQIISDSDLMLRMGKESAILYREKYHLDKMINSLESLYLNAAQ